MRYIWNKSVEEEFKNQLNSEQRLWGLIFCSFELNNSSNCLEIDNLIDKILNNFQGQQIKCLKSVYINGHKTISKQNIRRGVDFQELKKRFYLTD